MSGNNNNNHYFETLSRIQGELTEDRLVERIAECKAVMEELSKSYVWEVVIKDAQAMIKMLDDNWQSMPPNDLKFQEARVIKIACKQICDMPKKYEEELLMLQEKLLEFQSPDRMIEKDNDNN